MGAIFGVLIALFTAWIIIAMILKSYKPDWSDKKAGLVALGLAIWVILTLLYIGTQR